MLRCVQKPIALVLQCLGALSVVLSATHASAITVSPPWNYGSYTVTWGYATGCTYYYYYPPYFTYNCYWLEEKAPTGDWTTVATPNYSTSWSASGKPYGMYQYRIKRAFGDCCAGWYQAVADGPVSVGVGPPVPPPTLEQQQYATRHGDVDGDGDLDIYVKRIAGSSWQLPVQEMLLRQNANGTFGVETYVYPGTRAIVEQWGISVTQAKLVDFNVDGYFDIFIGGLSLAGVGPYDVVVFAADGPGAPPKSARLMDESIQRFAIDTAAYFKDPAYFNDAYQQVCDMGWYWWPGWRWDIDGYMYWYYMPMPWIDCYWIANPNFSYTAVQVAPSLAYVFEQGSLVAGTYHALTIDYYLRQLFGTPFMGGALASGLGFFPLGGEYSLSLLETRRMAETLGELIELLRLVNTAPIFVTPQNHYFRQDTLICHTSQPGCTPDLVYAKMLEVPVYGRGFDMPGHPNPCGDLHRTQCTVPVQNGDYTMVEIGEHPGADDDVGLVVHVVTPGERRLVNQTQEGHIFHPGQVDRQVVVDENGFVKITSIGTGTGPYPGLNESFGPSVFRGVDEVIKERVGGALP